MLTLLHFLEEKRDEGVNCRIIEQQGAAQRQAELQMKELFQLDGLQGIYAQIHQPVIRPQLSRLQAEAGT
jgi:hypothetical protein